MTSPNVADGSLLSQNFGANQLRPAEGGAPGRLDRLPNGDTGRAGPPGLSKTAGLSE